MNTTNASQSDGDPTDISLAARFMTACSYVIFGLIELMFLIQAIELGRFHFPSDSLLVACSYQLMLIVALVCFIRLSRRLNTSRGENRNSNLSKLWLPTLTIALLSSTMLFESLRAALNQLTHAALK